MEFINGAGQFCSSDYKIHTEHAATAIADGLLVKVVNGLVVVAGAGEKWAGVSTSSRVCGDEFEVSYGAGKIGHVKLAASSTVVAGDIVYGVDGGFADKVDTPAGEIQLGVAQEVVVNGTVKSVKLEVL